MKRILYTLLLSVLVFNVSCKKFLDTTPTDSLAPDGFLKTEKDVIAALTGVYDVLAKSSTYGRTFFFEMDVADDSFIALSSWTQDLGLYNYNPSDVKLTEAWTALYNGINRANMLLENIKGANMDQDKKDMAKGEALFLRAYYYFILTSNWGNVPLRLKATALATEVNFPNTPYKEIYAQIISDMEEAEKLVAPISSYTYGSRVSKSAVWGILARVNLKMAGLPLQDETRYAEVVKWAEKVKNAGHTLNRDYRQVFINMCEGTYDTKEVIWEVEFGKRNGTQAEEGSVGAINGIGANANIGYSYGAKHTTENYFRSFEVGDLRRDWNISSYYYGTDGSRVGYGPTQIYNRYDAKWRREYEKETPKFNGTTSINFPLLRYSDVLLMLAEAQNEITGPTPEAIAAVNEVRARAFGKKMNALEMVKEIRIVSGGTVNYTVAPTVTIVDGGGTGATATATISAGKVNNVYITDMGSGYTSAPTVIFTAAVGSGATATAVLTNIQASNFDLTAAEIADDEEFRKAIRKERSRELGYEGLRRFDLIRWGQFVSTMKSVANEINVAKPAGFTYASTSGNNVSEKDTLFAIPALEISLNKAIIQNKGW